MTLDLTSLMPAAVTFAAALIGGGIARSNLIASKETKISEFRQAWINALRDELAALFSNVRTMTRATQEARSLNRGADSRFNITQDKITEVRHGAAESFHKIKLRLNRGQDDHKELLRLLVEMMAAQQHYLEAGDGRDANVPLARVEAASDQAEKVLKSEWNSVKGGESAYRSAVKTTTWVLVGAGVVWTALIVGAPAYVFFSRAAPQATASAAGAQPQLPPPPKPSATSKTAEPAPVASRQPTK